MFWEVRVFPLPGFPDIESYSVEQPRTGLQVNAIHHAAKAFLLIPSGCQALLA